MEEEVIQQLRPDAKGRITLGKLARGVSSFRAHRLEDGNILLEPFAEIPAREAWLYENAAALGAVKAGLAQAAEGKTRPLGSFAQYADGEID
jgi:hypothetical protein